MRYFYFTFLLNITLLITCKKEEEQINDLLLYKLENTLQANNSLQKELLKMQEEIDLQNENYT
ncbi:hypothetical protein [Chishuiella sp.]|uniref:hypothetical protein n=1 Tax=Chishuiella sp. TaxID=1969467 RepID=UPI0028AFFB61|nr:hypothetical protein [Chishuiella sp.]